MNENSSECHSKFLMRTSVWLQDIFFFIGKAVKQLLACLPARCGVSWFAFILWGWDGSISFSYAWVMRGDTETDNELCSGRNGELRHWKGNLKKFSTLCAGVGENDFPLSYFMKSQLVKNVYLPWGFCFPF